MGALKLTICPSEALELVKQHQPLVWECKLYTFNAALLHTVDADNVTLTKALQHLLNKYNSTASKIYSLASYYHIMSETIKEYENVCNQLEKYEAQLLAIPKSIAISQEDRHTLTVFTNNQIKKLRARKKELHHYPEVINNIEVTAEIVLPNSA